jgi:hypothetical protein
MQILVIKDNINFSNIPDLKALVCQQRKILFHELGHLNVHACILCLTYFPQEKILNHVGNISLTSNTLI